MTRRLSQSRATKQSDQSKESSGQVGVPTIIGAALGRALEQKHVCMATLPILCCTYITHRVRNTEQIVSAFDGLPDQSQGEAPITEKADKKRARMLLGCITLH